MNRRFLLVLLFGGPLLLMMLATLPAWGSGETGGQSQTWPSRTPTPSNPPGPTNPPGTEPPSEQTSVPTSQPGFTPAATEQPPVNGPGEGQSPGPPSTSGLGTPTGGTEHVDQSELESIQLPSAAEIGDCGLPPVAVALGPVNARSGPGIEYQTLAKLAFQDERPIIGRAATEAWWQIVLPDWQVGWVSDQAVTIIGYTGLVPVTTGNQEDGNQPQWNPTPNPACTPPSQAEISVSDGQLAAVLTGIGPTPSPDIRPSAQADEDRESDVAPPPAFSVEGPEESASGFNMIWLPIVGGLLILAGGIALLIQRR